MTETCQLVADSGSTKTDWALGGLRLKTQGINPVHQTDEDVRKILNDELLPQLGDARVDAVVFYGSGVRADLEPKMQHLLAEAFPAAGHVEAHGDLLGAARALCGGSEGIACILGTGANSCLYDGRDIVMNTPPLGYILGDEGSGAVLGVKFLNALYKNRISDSIKEELEHEFGVSLSDVINRVYRQPMANRWLASLSEFIRRHTDHPAVRELVVDNFRQFVRYNVNPYQRRDLPLSAVGSIAYFYQDLLAEAVAEEGYQLGRILRSPIDALAGE